MDKIFNLLKKGSEIMNVLIVYAHPEPKSLNGKLKDVTVETLTANGHK